MNHFKVRSYIRLIGNVVDDPKTGLTRLTPEQIENMDDHFKLYDRLSNCQMEISQWTLPIKKPSIYDIRALITKEDVRREKKFYYKKQWSDNPQFMFARGGFKLLRKLIPDFDKRLDEFLDEMINEEKDEE